MNALETLNTLNIIGKKAKDAAAISGKLSANEKNAILEEAAKSLLNCKDNILKENELDIKDAIENGIRGAFIDRLTLTEKRIEAMAEGLRKVAAMTDPIGEVVYMKPLENGLLVGQKRIAIGVIAIIYEARPNVTSDAFGLCLKSGNSVILRGGKEALRTNQAIVSIFQRTLQKLGVNENLIQIISDTSRETAAELMKLNDYIDVLIPRGGATLIQSVIKNSTVPVIQTGVGNCHVFVDDTAITQNAIDIVVNAKAQRPGVCNACETLLVHEKIYETFLPAVCDALKNQKVEIRGDERVCTVVPYAIPASEKDWETEYEDYIIAVKVVADIDEAIAHIRKYSTQHSEAIITENYSNTQRFLNEIDSAAVYVNASTRFTDGEEFGFGAEIGISTQKLHARGPMGLKELTTTKYIIYGSGQIRT